MKKMLILWLMILLAHSSFSKNVPLKKDTLYYLVDTAQTPIADRIITIGIEASFKYYAIQCSCLKYNQKPTFYYNYKKTKGEQLLNFGHIKFITLKELIMLSQQDGGETFNEHHIAYFIEARGNYYVKHRVMLFKPQKHDIVY